jgi:hypothetical protein
MCIGGTITIIAIGTAIGTTDDLTVTLAPLAALPGCEGAGRAFVQTE